MEIVLARNSLTWGAEATTVATGVFNIIRWAYTLAKRSPLSAPWIFICTWCRCGCYGTSYEYNTSWI